MSLKIAIFAVAAVITSMQFIPSLSVIRFFNPFAVLVD
jgi:hypothetical protein